MSKSYDEIMEKIQMSQEAHGRILSNVVKKCSGGAPVKMRSLRMRKTIRYLTVAAAVIACVIIAPVFYHLQNTAVDQKDNEIMGTNKADTSDKTDGIEPSDENTMVVNGIIECASAEDLSEKVGFSIYNLKKESMPFKVNSTSYYSYWDYLAEIEYDGANGTYATYRMQAGDEDPSGDYNEYSLQETITLQNKNIQVSLKGNETFWNLAIWTYEGYSYSLYFSEGILKEDFIKILEATEMYTK